MIKRYSHETLAELWSDENKVAMWQKVELAVIEARVMLERVPSEILREIDKFLSAESVNIPRWLALEEELKHDLNAFVTERKEILPPHLRKFLHDELTSYDTEESAFVLILTQACMRILEETVGLDAGLAVLAKKYCFTPMNGRTHGQEAEMQSFGARVLTWLAELRLAKNQLYKSLENLKYSKMSGAIGKYGAIDPELEAKALGILGLRPFYGATQIVPRGLYLPTAQALGQICQAVDKIALDIRLMARSGKPLVQEPFGKKQTGSSAMPHKKNTISTEKIAGMARLAKGYLVAIEDNLSTWEERAIEQSSCERVAWPDLTHVTMHAIQTMTKVLKGLKVYPDNMLWEIVNSRGCYAAGQAKDWLKKYGSMVGIDEDSAYRIVQLAAFNVHEPSIWAKEIRESPYRSHLRLPEVALWEEKPISIQRHIVRGHLRFTEELALTEEKIKVWNAALQKLFTDNSRLEEWEALFQPSHLLRNEAFLFHKVLGWTPKASK